MGELATVKPVNVLATIDRARQMLAAVRTVPEAVELRDMLSAFLEVKKRCESSHKVRNLAAEIKIRCERKLGEMLGETIRHGGDVKSESRQHRVTLNDVGLSKTDSSRFQRIASIPESEFDSYVQTVMDEGLELTTAGTLRLWKSIETQHNPPQPRTVDDFVPEFEGEFILKWLAARRETWPAEFRHTFVEFVGRMLRNLEEGNADD